MDRNEDKLDDTSDDRITGIDVVDGVLTVKRRDGSILHVPGGGASPGVGDRMWIRADDFAIPGGGSLPLQLTEDVDDEIPSIGDSISIQGDYLWLALGVYCLTINVFEETGTLPIIGSIEYDLGGRPGSYNMTPRYTKSGNTVVPFYPSASGSVTFPVTNDSEGALSVAVANAHSTTGITVGASGIITRLI